MSGIRTVAFATLAAAALVPWVSVVPAQGPQGRDYLSAELRAQVEELQRSASSTPTSAANLKERLDTLWPWINAYALTGGPMPVNATLQVATAYRAIEALRLDGAQPSAGVLEAIDGLVHEFTIKDKQPGALGTVSLEVAGPAHVGAWTTIKQTYTVGEASLGPGARIMVAKQLQADGGLVQNSDPDGPHYLSASTSNREVRLGNTSFPWVGMHGGFRSPAPMPTFKVEEGTLKTGDTVTIVYGDRSAGSEGWRLQTFATDQAMLPIYIDLDGSGNFLTPRWPSFEIVGAGAEGVTAVVPSIAEPGEEFDLSIRWEDSNGNRATAAMPGAAVTLNGGSFRTLDAGGDALQVIEAVRLDEEGIYRFEVTSSDGRIKALSNPVWVRRDPPYRLYWGETHTHTGMAEGQGSIVRSYRFAREDARLDFMGLSEHDIWLDDLEWQTMRQAVESNTVPGEFVAFLGYEWTLRRQWGGHHNVFFRSPDAGRVGAQIAPTLTGLYEGLRSRYATEDVLIIPHAHQAGGLADERSGNGDDDRDHVDARDVRVVRQLLPATRPPSGLPCRVGRPPLPARLQLDVQPRQPNSSLSQFGGLAGVQAEAKTADSIFDSLKRRSAYAVTDAQRIILEMEVNGTGMGTRSEYRDKRRLRAKVVGTSPIRRVAGREERRYGLHQPAVERFALKQRAGGRRLRIVVGTVLPRQSPRLPAVDGFPQGRRRKAGRHAPSALRQPAQGMGPDFSERREHGTVQHGHARPSRHAPARARGRIALDHDHVRPGGGPRVGQVARAGPPDAQAGREALPGRSERPLRRIRSQGPLRHGRPRCGHARADRFQPAHGSRDRFRRYRRDAARRLLLRAGGPARRSEGVFLSGVGWRRAAALIAPVAGVRPC